MICRTCSAPMMLDALIASDARRGLDPGMPTPVVMRCRNGHSERLNAATAPDADPATFRATPRCAICGVEIPRQRGAAPRKSCGPEHKRVIEVKRVQAQAAHNRAHRLHRADVPFVPFRFVVEAQPWYRGAATAFQPLAPPPEFVIRSGPVFPEIPAAWLEGFRALYPVLAEPAPVLPSTFPAIEDLDPAGPLPVQTRRYGRRKPKVAPTREQIMPDPVGHA